MSDPSGMEEDYSEDFEASVPEQPESEPSSAPFEEEAVSRDQDTSNFSGDIQLTSDDTLNNRDEQSQIQQQEELSQGIPDELKGLTHYFEGGGGDVSDDVSISLTPSASGSQSHPPQSNSNTQSESQSHSLPQAAIPKPPRDDDSVSLISNKSNNSSRSKKSRKGDKSKSPEPIEDIMAKLARLANVQTALENLLDSQGSMDEGALKAALGKADIHIPDFNSGARLAEEEDPLSLNLSAEMEALKKLAEGKADLDLSRNSGRLDPRHVEQIFKQYDELERSRAQSFDEEDSIRSDKVPLKSTSKSRPMSSTSLDKSFEFAKPLPVQQVQPHSSSSMTQPDFRSHFDSLNYKIPESNSSTPKVPTTSTRPPQSLNQPMTSSTSSSLTMTEGLGSFTTQPKPDQRLEASPSPLSHSSRSRPEKSKPAETTASASSSKPASRNYLKESASLHGLVRERPVTPPSPSMRNFRTISSPKKRSGINPSRHEGGGEGSNLQEDYLLKIRKLEDQIARQETLIDAFQQENQKLYKEVKNHEKEHETKEAEWQEITNSLKTEIATLKISRLAGSPARPGSAHKAEVERVRHESDMKSHQIMELRKEIIELRNAKAETARPTSANKGRAALIAQEREKESQKTIHHLSKQVRTLQKILYNRDPVAASTLAKASSRGDLTSSQDRLNTADGERNEAQVAVLENRIAELEKNLSQADEIAKDQMKDFQARMIGYKGKCEDQVQVLELKLADSAKRIEFLESELSESTVQDLKGRYDKSQAEVGHLKQEINRYKRDLEIAQKSSMSTAVSQAAVNKDAGTLNLAIKTFKSELAEKEKQIIRLKKEVADLNKTNASLKREREKYLNLANALSLPGAVPNYPRIATRVGLDGGNQGLKPEKTTHNPGSKSRLSSPTRGPSNANLATVQMLQSAMEYDRTEFEQMIEKKKKELHERDQIITNLKREVEELKDKTEDQVDDSRRSHMLNELRSRVTTQNELIHKLKDHIANYRRIEGDYLLMKQENGQAEVQIKELKAQLELAKLQARPENEVLEVLMTKLDDLNSRYLKREMQINGLLNRLTVRTGCNYLSPRLTLSSGTNLEEEFRRTELDLRQLSPTIAMQLLSSSSDSL